MVGLILRDNIIIKKDRFVRLLWKHPRRKLAISKLIPPKNNPLAFDKQIFRMFYHKVMKICILHF